ncbi:MAG: NAD(P)H-binding protein [Acidimicrobiales bacterium]
MEQILVTGGTGTLGRVIVRDLLAHHASVRVLSRQAKPVGAEAEWAVGDLRSGVGIDDAVMGIDTIIHCASRRGDVASAQHLLDAAKKANCSHIVFISIVGVDRIPLRYYKGKLEVERLIEASGVPYTVVRATQFHDLIARLLGALARLPVMVLPAHVDFQPIEVAEVAARLVQLSSGPPAGRVPDMGGPEIRGTKDLARSYLRASGRRRLIVSVPVPGRGFAGFRRGANLTPEHAVGVVGFDEYLAVNLRT